MGNQHDSQRSSMKRTTPTIEQSREKSDQQQQVIDLDEIVEQWIWSMWNRTKTKASSHYKREELLIKINWKHVIFIQSDVNFSGSPPVRLPKSQILFRTHFNNKTTNEQSYLFKTERFTRSTFKFTFTNRLIKSQESVAIFRLPDEVVELGGGIKPEQSVEYGHETIKEYNMRWNVNSQIRVAPCTRTYAELNIDEEEFHADFTFYIQFFGRITATVTTRQEPNIYLQFIDGDIVQIIRETLGNTQRVNGLQIIETNPVVVRFMMRGKCTFRYGVQQHIVLNQESLDPPSSPIEDEKSSISSSYRPLRPYLTLSTNNIHLRTVDDVL